MVENMLSSRSYDLKISHILSTYTVYSLTIHYTVWVTDPSSGHMLLTAQLAKVCKSLKRKNQTSCMLYKDKCKI